MKARTIELIKNFSTINPGLLFIKGNRLRTLSVARNIFAVAEIPEELPRDFAIYDLKELLSTISLFKSPTLEYKDDHILISEGKSRIKYQYSAPSVVVSPPANDIKMTDPDHVFELSETVLKQITNASAVLKLPSLGVSHGKIRAYDPKKDGNQITIDIDSEGREDSVERLLNIENMKLIEGSYKVEVYSKALRFENIADPSLSYFITVESKETQR